MKKRTLILSGMAAVAAGAAGWLYCRYRQQTERRTARLLAESHVRRIASGEIEYATAGKGPAILVLHGALGGYDHGIALSPILPDFHVIAPSRFGYLRSSVPADASPAAQADACAALLDDLGIAKAAVVAISGGGASALQFALRHPDLCWGLVMVSAVSQPPPETQERGLVLILNLVLNNANFLFWLIETFGQDAILQAVGLSPETRSRLKKENPQMLDVLREIIRFTPLSLRRAGQINDNDWAGEFERLPIERISAPTFVVHGTADRIIPYTHGEWVAQTVPGARLLSIEGGGHLSFFVHSEITLPALEEFLREHAPSI
jgi:2-hydroxy-6-oxonona-2,4-dienedioate hydrolase